MLKGETRSSDDVGATAKLSVFFAGTGGIFFPVVLYRSGRVGTGGGIAASPTRSRSIGVEGSWCAGNAGLGWRLRVVGVTIVSSFRGVPGFSVGLMLSTGGLDGRIDVGIGGGDLIACSRIGDGGRLIRWVSRDGGTGGGVFDKLPPYW